VRAIRRRVGPNRGFFVPAAQALTLLDADHQDIPLNGSADAVAAGPTKTHQPLACLKLAATRPSARSPPSWMIGRPHARGTILSAGCLHGGR